MYILFFIASFCFSMDVVSIGELFKATKAGISAESTQSNDGYNPLNIFIARDHHYSDNYFNNIYYYDWYRILWEITL